MTATPPPSPARLSRFPAAHPRLFRRLRPAAVLALALAVAMAMAAATALQSPATAAEAEAEAEAGTPQRPNLVVFLVDDLGLMDTSVPFLTDDDGRPVRHPLNDFYRTPGMERLAAKGIRFNEFNAMSVCSPTRVTMMTGQNPARHGTTTWINPDNNNAGPLGPPDWNWLGLQPGDTSLAALLGDGGYTTVHVGKAHFGPRHTEGSDPANLGFDINIGGASFGAPGSYFAEDDYGFSTNRRRMGVPHLEDYHGTDVFLTEALTRETLKVVDDLAEDGQPFFLHLSHYAVHTPFQTDPRFAGHYEDSGKSDPAIAFATLVEGIDKSLADLLDHLHELGIAENTLVIFLGDNGGDAPLGDKHGITSSAPLRGKKGAHYEGGVRVPFIAAWAAPNPDHPLQQQLPIPAGAIQNRLASVEDLFPTLLQLAGVEPPDDHVVDGQPLQRLLTGADDDGREVRFLMHFPHGPHRSVYWSSLRDQDWKVIYHYHPSDESDGGHYQLYHLAEDPAEQHNLADQQPDKLREMMQRLIDELETHGALYPLAGENGEPAPPRLP